MSQSVDSAKPDNDQSLRLTAFILDARRRRAMIASLDRCAGFSLCPTGLSQRSCFERVLTFLFVIAICCPPVFGQEVPCDGNLYGEPVTSGNGFFVSTSNSVYVPSDIGNAFVDHHHYRSIYRAPYYLHIVNISYSESPGGATFGAVSGPDPSGSQSGESGSGVNPGGVIGGTTG